MFPLSLENKSFLPEYAVWVFLNRYLGDEMPALATDLVHPPRPISSYVNISE